MLVQSQRLLGATTGRATRTTALETLAVVGGGTAAETLAVGGTAARRAGNGSGVGGGSGEVRHDGGRARRRQR